MREGWRRRRERLSVQDGCLFEWKNIIAESARKGCADEYELQWDSFNKLERQLKQEWLESIEKRKKMPKPKGNSRAPKSFEQRRKISEAISAKWADQVSQRLSSGVYELVSLQRKSCNKIHFLIYFIACFSFLFPYRYNFFFRNILLH